MSLAVAEDAEEVGDEEGAEHEDGREQRRVRLGQVLLEGNPTTFRMCNRMYYLQHVLVFVKLKLVALHSVPARPRPWWRSAARTGSPPRSPRTH